MQPSTEVADLLALIVRLANIGIAVRSLELVVNWRVLRDSDLLGWGGVATSRSALGRMLQRLQGYPFCVGVPAVRGGAAVAAFFLPYGSLAMTVTLALLLLAQVYHNHRFVIVFAASEHLLLVLLCALFFGSLPSASLQLQVVCLGFIVFQAFVAYAAAAKHKLFTPHWRSGEQLIYVFEGSGFRFPPLGRFFRAHPDLARFATWAIITLHLSFPLGLVLPAPGFWLIIAGGMLFHGTLAVTTGLHGFFWTFVATYPAMYYFHALIAARLYSH